GYRVRHRNWSHPAGAIDLVAPRGKRIIFVGIETRSSENYDDALGAVDEKKQGQLAKLASLYLSQFNLWEQPTRFDVVAVQRRQTFPWWRLLHVKDAFQPNLGRQV
ncbi:MAG: YraN family protein, partial [bacterium]|nr:YraN family protein [bacterium]